MVGGEPVRPDRTPRKAEWDRFTIIFADGGRLRLFDKRRLGRVRLDPDLDALGPDAEMISRPDFRMRVRRGRSAVKARLLDQSVLAGVGNLLADETLWQARALAVRARRRALRTHPRHPATTRWSGPLKAAIANGGVHTGEVIEHRHVGRSVPPLRRGDGARHGRRPLHVVVLGRAGLGAQSRDEQPDQPSAS